MNHIDVTSLTNECQHNTANSWLHNIDRYLGHDKASLIALGGILIVIGGIIIGSDKNFINPTTKKINSVLFDFWWTWAAVMFTLMMIASSTSIICNPMIIIGLQLALFAWLVTLFWVRSPTVSWMIGIGIFLFIVALITTMSFCNLPFVFALMIMVILTIQSQDLIVWMRSFDNVN